MRKKLGISNKYLAWGVTAFCVIAGAILFFLVLTRWSGARSNIMSLLDVLSPVIYGLMLAYIFNKIMVFVEARLILPLFKRLGGGEARKSLRAVRAVSVTLTIIIALLLIGGTVLLIVPQIYGSLESLVSALPGYYAKAVEWITGVLEDNPELESTFVNMAGNITDWLTSFIQTTVISQAEMIISNIVGGVLGVIKVVFNLAVGIVISVYVLFQKEMFCAQAKKITYGLFKTERANKLVRGVAFLDKTCGSYITSKLVDALIVGVLTYVFMLITGMPYAMLISVIIAITNIIPFFGPFIGGVPSGILILLVNPTQGLIFGIFIVVMQQIDGNVIYPKIQGDSLGISGFWIIVSLLVFSGLFGFWGMMLGVPVFAVIYAALRGIAQNHLKSRGMPINTVDYEKIYVFDEETKSPVYKDGCDTSESGDGAENDEAESPEPDGGEDNGERGEADNTQGD